MWFWMFEIAWFDTEEKTIQALLTPSQPDYWCNAIHISNTLKISSCMLGMNNVSDILSVGLWYGAFRVIVYLSRELPCTRFRLTIPKTRGILVCACYSVECSTRHEKSCDMLKSHSPARSALSDPMNARFGTTYLSRRSGRSRRPEPSTWMTQEHNLFAAPLLSSSVFKSYTVKGEHIHGLLSKTVVLNL